MLRRDAWAARIAHARFIPTPHAACVEASARGAGRGQAGACKRSRRERALSRCAYRACVSVYIAPSRISLMRFRARALTFRGSRRLSAAARFDPRDASDISGNIDSAR